MRSVADDLTAAARIRDAAVLRFAEFGFGSPVRQIAEDAGVSAGLVIHHFGSKDNLRQACDEYVLAAIHDAKTDLVTGDGRGQLLQALASVTDFAPLAGYALRSLTEGGQGARRFLDHFVDDIRAFLDAGVVAGTVKPSRDPAARARYLALQGLGVMLLELNLSGGLADLDEMAATVQRLTELTSLPALELYTEGLLTDSTLLDTYLDYRDRR